MLLDDLFDHFRLLKNPTFTIEPDLTKGGDFLKDYITLRN
jgi:hypothetical protein